jgi:predicted phosphodiesterase
VRYAVAILFVLVAAVAVTASSFVHGPYSGAPSADSVCVSWLSSEPLPARVEYGLRSDYEATGTLAESVETSPEDPDKTETVHVTLTGLDPDAKYVYRVVLETPDEKAVSPVGRFATEPPPGETVQFAVLGDTQWQWEGVNRLEAVGDAIAADPADFDFILHVGDLVESPTTTYWDNWFASFHDMLLRAPFLPVLGNHEKNHRTYYENFVLPPGGGKDDKRWWALHWGDVVVVGLDTNVTQAAKIMEEQDWARTQLSGSEKYKIVIFHHPVFSSDAYYGGGYSYDKIYHPIFVEEGVDLVINGHAHNYERIVRDGVTYVVAGGGGAVPSALADEHIEGSIIALTGYNFYLRITASSDDLHVDTVSVARADENSFELTDGHLLDSFDLPAAPSKSVNTMWIWLLLGVLGAALAGFVLVRAANR